MSRTGGRNWEEMPSWRRGHSGHMKNQNSMMPENYEEFFSLTLRTRNSKRPLRMLARNWKRQWLPLCFARKTRTVSMVRPVVNPMKSNQNLRVFWKPVNPQDCVWENLYRIIIKTILQEKETVHCNTTVWYTYFPMPQAMKIPAAKAAVDKECEKLEKIPAWDNKSQKWERGDRWSKDEGRKSSFFLTDGHLSIRRMPNWRQNTKITNVELYSEVILWKTILDLTQYSLNRDHQHHKWQRQKSWISFPGCRVAQDKQLTQCLLIPCKNGRCTQMLKIPKSECPDIWIRQPRHKWP